MPGFGGQEFDDVAIEKLHELSTRTRLRCPVGSRRRSECGIRSGACAEAGAELFVAGTAIFRTDDYRGRDPGAFIRQRSVRSTLITQAGNNWVKLFYGSDTFDSPRHNRIRPAGRVQGTLNIPLCEDGRQQVGNDGRCTARSTDRGRLRESLPIGRPNSRALAQALDLKVKTIEKFENLDQGLWQGMLVSDVKAKQPKVYRQCQEQPEKVCPPQGETLCYGQAAGIGGAREAAEKTQVGRCDRDRGARAPGERCSPRRAARRVGRLVAEANESAQWQLIDVPETVAAK